MGGMPFERRSFREAQARRDAFHPRPDLLLRDYFFGLCIQSNQLCSGSSQSGEH